MATKASKLEDDLVEFVESHPETFSEQDVKNLRRSIIIFFSQIVGPPYLHQQNVIYCVKLIIENIYDKLKVKSITTSQDVKDALKLFELCMECQSIIGGHGIIGMLEPPLPPDYKENFYELVKRKINEYHAKVFKLWADVLVHEGKITQPAIDVMQTYVSEKDGYERKMRELYVNPSGMVWARGHIKNNLDESVLLEFLTLFRVATPAQMTASYNNIGPLDSIVLLIISQFVQIDNVGGFSLIPTGNHMSELNVLKLKCVVILKPSQSQSPLPPIFAYLSSDILDQCVRYLSHFPTMDEFLQCTATEFQPLSPSFWEPTPTSPTSPTSPTPQRRTLLEEGGKIRRNTNKKRKKCKKNRRSHRR